MPSEVWRLESGIYHTLSATRVKQLGADGDAYTGQPNRWPTHWARKKPAEGAAQGPKDGPSR